MPTLIKGPQAKTAGVHPDHMIAETLVGRNKMRFTEAPETVRAPDPAEKKALELLEQSLKKTRTEV